MKLWFEPFGWSLALQVQQGCISISKREVAVAATGTRDHSSAELQYAGQAETQALQIHCKKQEMQFPERM